MKDSNVFSCICDVTVKDINNPSKEELDYLFSFPDNLEKSIYQYVETKTISKFLVNHIKSNGAPIDSFIYRGDCFYKGNVGVGKRFKLWRDVASFSKDFNTAKHFANVKCVPDWYYDEIEWYVDCEYPFRKNLDLGECLFPVILKLDGNNDLLKLFSTEHKINRFGEFEYIMYVQSLEFEFVKLTDVIDGIDVWLVKPIKCEKIKFI